VRKAGDFAEAFNQRAVLHFRLGQFREAIADCQRALELNPHHFGAAAGMAQCYMKLKKPRAALRSFRNALRINPNLEDVAETIRALEDVLGD
jgi:Tfp pilus assembly protein PilF